MRTFEEMEITLVAFLVFDHARFINCNGNMVIFCMTDCYHYSLICFFM